MKSFKEFLTEVKRDRQRATKLLNHVYKKQRFNKVDNPLRKGFSDDYHTVIPWTYHDKSNFKVGNDYIRSPSFKNKPLVDVPVGHLVTAQERVSRSVVSKKIHGKFPDHDPEHPQVVHYQGKYHIWDGNHRANKARLMDKKTIKAQVVHATHYEE